MSDHSAGPWRVFHPFPDRMAAICAESDPMTALAYVGARGYPNEANARLIASAPALLDAAERALFFLGALEESDALTDVYGAIGDEQARKCVAHLRAAIARAEGRQP